MGTRRLLGEVAIVTGAAHGIGRAICVELAREGASVWACDVLERELTETRRAVGERAEGPCRTARRLGPGAGELSWRWSPQGRSTSSSAAGAWRGSMRPIEEVTEEDWRRIFAINLDGAFHFTRAVAPAMKARGRGSIVNISSGAGRSYSLTGIQAYASAKAGLIGLTRQTARELGAFGIRVNSVAPGFIRSNPATERQWAAMGPEGQARLLDGIALRRLGEPEDIARVVVFFASDDARYVTGQTISADGGHWMLG
jgi:3-oxoacyl-[acyl-carrier protein] reductase